MLQDRDMFCLKARPCIIQPGHFTGWGSEGVKHILHNGGRHSVFTTTASTFCSDEHAVLYRDRGEIANKTGRKWTEDVIRSYGVFGVSENILLQTFRWVFVGKGQFLLRAIHDYKTDRQTDRQADWQEGRQTDRQTGRQAGRQTGRQADRQTETERETPVKRETSR